MWVNHHLTESLPGIIIALQVIQGGCAMATISLRINDADYNLIQEYVSVNSINLSAFIREAVLDKIEDDLNLDEKRILSARKCAETEKKYDHTEVWEKLGV